MTAPYSGAPLPSPQHPLGSAVAHVLAARHLTALHRRLRQIGAITDPSILQYLDGLHWAVAASCEAHAAVRDHDRSSETPTAP